MAKQSKPATVDNDVAPVLEENGDDQGRRRRCFVISPIGVPDSTIREHADDVFRFVIEPAVKQFDMEAVRADHIDETGRITELMFTEIFEADLCIALLTGFNPNVFYELAVAQAAGCPVILLIEEGCELPFDIKDLNTVSYATQPVAVLVDGEFSARVARQIAGIAERGWSEPTLFELYGGAPRTHDEQRLRRLLESSRPPQLSVGSEVRYQLPDGEGQEIVVQSGNLARLKDIEVDVVVSLEDTYLQLSRYHDPDISGILRYLDAEKSEGQRIVRDSLKESLLERIEELDIVLPTSAGAVIANPTHGLAARGVKFVFHVAAMQGTYADGYRTLDDVLDDCVRNVLDKFGEMAESEGLETLMLPMLGAGTSRLEPVEVASALLRPIVRKMTEMPRCKKLFLLAWIAAHREAVLAVAEEMGLERKS